MESDSSVCTQSTTNNPNAAHTLDALPTSSLQCDTEVQGLDFDSDDNLGEGI